MKESRGHSGTQPQHKLTMPEQNSTIEVALMEDGFLRKEVTVLFLTPLTPYLLSIEILPANVQGQGVLSLLR